MKWTNLILLVCLFNCISWTLSAQSKIKATGTGNTTGHIANLTIHNKADAPMEINDQTAYIPSSGQYQPYIVTIPRTTVPPGTITIPLTGYCADVTSPPVPLGEAMPPLDDWIAVGTVTTPGPGVPLVNIVEDIVPPFRATDIYLFTRSRAFTPIPLTLPEIQLTWPGTDILVRGVLDPRDDPKSTAPVLIEALQNIENAFDSLRMLGEITTPFAGDPPRERESVIQQTFWIYAAGLTGERYQRENFNDRVIEQYESNVGIAVSKLPEHERNRLDEGVDDFWNTFMATGVEAKVIKQPEESGERISPDLLQANKTSGKNKAKECSCDTMEILYALNIPNKAGNMIAEGASNQIAVFGEGKKAIELKKITASASNVEKGKIVDLTVTPKIKCSCSEGAVECKERVGKTVVIKHKKEVLEEKFTLGAVPYEINVTITQTCGDDDCKEATCTVTIPILIEKKKEEK